MESTDYKAKYRELRKKFKKMEEEMEEIKVAHHEVKEVKS